MRYSSSATQREKPREQMNPIWRGVGCLMIVLIGGGSFFLAIWLIDLATKQNWPYAFALVELGNQLTQSAGAVPVVGNLIIGEHRLGWYGMPAVLALLATIFAYGIVTFFWGFASHPGVDPLDVRSPAPKKKRKIRKCR